MNLRNLAVAALLAATATAAQQPFDLDMGFMTQFSLGSGTGYPLQVFDVMERPDGKIIVSGNIQPPGIDPTTSHVGGLVAPNGSWIPAPAGTSFLNWYGGLGGKIVPWGEDRFYTGGMISGVMRYWMNGARDSLYPVIDPKIGFGQGGDFHVFPDGRVLMTGNYPLHDTLHGFVDMSYGLVWRNNDGSLDTTRIHRRINPYGTIWSIQELPDGRFICGGGGGLFEGDSISDFVFRIHADASLDTSFHAPWIDFGYVTKVLPQSDGKILVSGVFHIAGDPDTLGLIRLLPDGTMDASFNNHMDNLATYVPPGVGARQGVLDILPIGSNMLAITGGFDRIDGQTRGGIAMLDTAGYLLPGYFEGNGCGAWNYSMPIGGIGPFKHIKSIEPAQDGGYFIYGSYSGYDDGNTNDPSQRFISKLYGLNVGINEQPTRSATLHIAPNPSHGGAVQLSVDEVPKRAILSIHDASGRVALREEWPAGRYTHTLQAGALAPGTYVVRVSFGSAQDDTRTGRLVVMP